MKANETIVIRKINLLLNLNRCLSLSIQILYYSMMYPQIDYDMHLISELKAKNKQITFLEDKIILMQKERQNKIQEMQQKYHQKLKKLKCINSALDQQNCQLRQKFQSCKSKICAISQQYKKSFQQSKELLQLKYMNQQQVKKIRTKLQKQKKNNHKLQQENLQLKTVLAINQKTMKELNAKIHKMAQQKNILLSTYGDYDQIKHDLSEISKIYQDQYQSQLQLVKNRLRCEMEENTKQIMNDFNLQPICSKKISNHYTSTVRRYKSAQRLINQQSDDHVNMKIEDLKENQNLLASFTKTLERSNQKGHSTAHYNYKQQSSNLWQADMINLQNYCNYGAQYVSSFSGENLNQQQSRQIYKFIKKTISEKQQMKNQNLCLSEQIQQAKEEMQERMIFIETTMKEINSKNTDRVNVCVQTVQTQVPILRVADMNIILKNKVKQCGEVIAYLTGIFMVLCQTLSNNNYKIQRYYRPIVAKNKQGKQKNMTAKNRLKSIFLSVFFVEHLKKKAKKTKRLQRSNQFQKNQKCFIQDKNISKIVQKCVTQYQRSKIQKPLSESLSSQSNCQIERYISLRTMQKNVRIVDLIGLFLNQQTLAIIGKQRLQIGYNF